MVILSGTAGGERLRRLRRDRQVSQQWLADVSGLSVRTVRGLETGSIVTPRTASVRALADGLGLGPDDAEDLLARWGTVSDEVSWGVVTGEAEFDEFLADASAAAVSRHVPVSITTLAVVGADRRFTRRDNHTVLRVETDGDDADYIITGSDQAVYGPDTRFECLYGCAPRAHHGDPGRGLAVAILEFPRPLRAGEFHVLGYRCRPDPRYSEFTSTGVALADSDGIAQGWRRPLALATVTVRFAGPRPASVRTWQDTDEPARPVRLDREGCATRVLYDCEPGNYGFEWQW